MELEKEEKSRTGGTEGERTSSWPTRLVNFASSRSNPAGLTRSQDSFSAPRLSLSFPHRTRSRPRTRISIFRRSPFSVRRRSKSEHVKNVKSGDLPRFKLEHRNHPTTREWRRRTLNPERRTFNAFHHPGSSHFPVSAERKIASMTAMFRIEPSSETGNSVPSRMLWENKSPWMVY
jgi:hypothetical protein